jgi:hypothetical protein
MAICDDCFEDFVHPLCHELMEKNKAFETRYGDHKRWDWDDEAVKLTFSDPSLPTVQIEVAVVGSTEGDSWQWSWANRNYSPRSRIGIDEVRTFGETKGFAKLTTRFLESDEYTGWEMTAVAAHVLNAPGAYRFPTERGFCYLLYRTIAVLRVERVSKEVQAENRPRITDKQPFDKPQK